MRRLFTFWFSVLCSASCGAQYLYWNSVDTATNTWWQSQGRLGIEHNGQAYQYDRLYDSWVGTLRISSIDSVGNMEELRRYGIPPSYNGPGGLTKYAMIPMDGNKIIHCTARDSGNMNVPDLGTFPVYFYLDGLDSIGFERDLTQLTGTGPVLGSPLVNINWGDDRFLSVCGWNPDSPMGLKGLRMVLKPFGGGVISDHLWTQDQVDTLAFGVYSGIKWTEDTALVLGPMNWSYATSLFDTPTQGTTFLAKIPLSADTMIYRFIGNPLTNNAGIGEGDMIKMENGHVLVIYTYFDTPVGYDWIYKLRACELDAVTMEVVNNVEIPVNPLDQIASNTLACRGVYKGPNGGYLCYLENYPIGGTGPGMPYVEYRLIKLHEDLTVDWIRSYSPPMNIDTYSQNIINITTTSDGGYLCSGEASSQSQPYPRSWSLKIDACGYLQPSGCPAVVGVDDRLSQEPAMQLWPNPTTGMAHAILPTSTNRINVRDILGRIVYTEPVYYPRQDWNFDFLSPGNYLLEAVQDNGVAVATRLVIQAR